jgi:uncharacterized repeat protein (TIGR02543 family)
VPDSADQTVYNQFRYSAIEADSGTAKINLNSPVAGFSTEAIAIVYDANLPTTSHGNNLRNMPANIFAIIHYEPASDSGSGRRDTLTVAGESPTLSGHSFIGWNTDEEGAGKSWSAGENKVFSQGGVLVLYAQWARESYTVGYLPGEHGTFDAEYKPAYYGDDTPPAPETTGDPGWAFTRWDPVPSATVTKSVNYTALWNERQYKVYYDLAGGSYDGNPSIDPKTVRWTDTDLLPGGIAYDQTLATKSGYSLSGWRVTSGGSAVRDVRSTDKYSDLAANETTTQITLTAQWEATLPPPEAEVKIVIVNFINNYTETDDRHYLLGESSNAGAKLGEKLNAFTGPDRQHEGYTFAGWYRTRTGGSAWNFAVDLLTEENGVQGADSFAPRQIGRAHV